MPHVYDVTVDLEPYEDPDPAMLHPVAHTAGQALQLVLEYLRRAAPQIGRLEANAVVSVEKAKVVGGYDSPMIEQEMKERAGDLQ